MYDVGRPRHPRGGNAASSAGSPRTDSPCGARTAVASGRGSPRFLPSVGSRAMTGSRTATRTGSTPQLPTARLDHPHSVRPAQGVGPRRRKPLDRKLSDLGTELVDLNLILLGEHSASRPWRKRQARHRAAAVFRRSQHLQRHRPLDSAVNRRLFLAISVPTVDLESTPTTLQKAGTTSIASRGKESLGGSQLPCGKRPPVVSQDSQDAYVSLSTGVRPNEGPGPVEMQPSAIHICTTISLAHECQL